MKLLYRVLESVFSLTVWLQKIQELIVFWTGTHDFSQDESQDSP